MKLKIAQVAVQRQIRTNKETILTVLRSARKDEWVVFPEGALSGYFPEEAGYLEDLDKSELDIAMLEVADVVKSRGCHCLYGSATYEKSGWRNSVVIESHSGPRQLYQKIELSTLDISHFEPGRDVSIYRLDGVTFGVQVCRELIFSRAWQSLKKQGAQIVFHVNNALRDKDEVWRHVSIARALEGAIFVCSVNNGASPQKLSSHLISPGGTVLLEAQPSYEHILSAEIDVSEVIEDLGRRRDY